MFCAFKSNSHTHQTLPGASPSDRYTCIGFSCQISEAIAHAVVVYINGTAPSLKVAGQKNKYQMLRRSWNSFLISSLFNFFASFF
jgi:hypothetical protein